PSFLAEPGWRGFQPGAMPAGLGMRLMQRALRLYNDSPRLRTSLRNLSGPAVNRVRQVLRNGGLLPTLQNIDWPHTRVFSTRFGLDLYVHRSDKFPQGIVTPEASDSLCDEVSAKLLALRDEKKIG